MEGQPAMTQEKEHEGLVVAGWITTFLITPVGFIIAIILTAKGRAGHGVAMMIVAVVGWIIVFSLLAASASEDLSAYSECIDAAQTTAQMEAC